MFANLLNAVKRRDRFTLEELRRLNDVVARTTTVTTANRDALVETFGVPWYLKVRAALALRSVNALRHPQTYSNSLRGALPRSCLR